MIKFVLDADGAIKLAKASVLGVLAVSSACLLPQRVYGEIMKGKEKMYEDAFITENLVAESKIRVIASAPAENLEGLGVGEMSALAVFKKENADAIITDDARFIGKLKEQDVPFLVPVHAIVWLFKERRINKQEGLAALERIRSIVRNDAYAQARKALGGE